MDTEGNNQSVWVLETEDASTEKKDVSHHYWTLREDVQIREHGKKIELHGKSITVEQFPTNEDKGVPLLGRYAKINDGDLMSFWIQGGKYENLATDVYIWEGWMRQDLPKVTKRPRRQPANENNTEGNGKEQKPEANIDDNTPSRHIFARNQNGQAFALLLSDRCDSLTKVIKKAIESTQSGGSWSRAVNVPIRLYLVPVDKSDAAMKRLEKDVETAQKSFPSQAVEVKRATELLEKSANGKQKYRKIGISPLRQYETWIEEAEYQSYNTAIPTQTEPAEEQVKNATKLIGPPKKDDKDAVNSSNPAADIPPPPPNHTLATVVTAEKVNAPKPEKREPDQRVVMGRSATEIANTFGWVEDKQPDKWPVPPHLSEWLHRIAFSWGGLGDKPNHKSAQVHSNLIFGSYECNSLMTRYECAWQQLVSKENSYRKYSNQAKAQGVLSTSILRDFYTTCFGNELQSRQPGHLSSPQVPHWICCAMNYSLTLDSQILNGQCGDLKTWFYPLQRGFFTTFEAKLDTVILDRFYTHAKNSSAAKSNTTRKLPIRPVKRPKPGGSGIPSKVPKPAVPSTSAVSVA